jgi:hypothetical protein
MISFKNDRLKVICDFVGVNKIVTADMAAKPVKNYEQP